ncbi:hypothetical protein QVD17_14114 [Tagetes erecta]|uniref:Uncharacterized protein n=1 Tax=Tagetes erecta TaxID=13708 RepID=A0AAD8L2Y3_TARER|nr:hypothetical protein QVD17_14114 [Tagetes erecta]
MTEPLEKRKPTNTTATHPPKRCQHTTISSNSEETKDTATSETKNQEEDEQVEIDDIDVYRELEDYETRNGVNPVVDYDHMKRFCFPYTHMGIGNEGGWENKIRHLKFKFKNDQIVHDDQMEEFLLWKKMFARVRPPDTESRIS